MIKENVEFFEQLSEWLMGPMMVKKITEWVAASKEEMEALAGAYGRYFCGRMADMLRAASHARISLEAGKYLQARRRETLTRSEWMRRCTDAPARKRTQRVPP